jgi:hypothetical protein
MHIEKFQRVCEEKNWFFSTSDSIDLVILEILSLVQCAPNGVQKFLIKSTIPQIRVYRFYKYV